MASKPTIPRICQRCGTAFLTVASQVRLGKALYCSIACKAARYAQPITFTDDGLTALISLCSNDGTVRAYALIDSGDAEWAGQWQWHLSDGHAVRNGPKTERPRRSILLHRALLGLPRVSDGREGDHRDRNRLNDRRANLRVIPKPGNPQNVPSYRGASSLHRGVAWHKKDRKWVAYVQVDGKQHHLGEFSTELEAAEVAKAARDGLLPYAVD